MSKKAYRPCPRPSGCVWDTYARTGEHLCMLSVCPYTAVSPAESENGMESCTDDLTNRCEDE